MPRASNGGAGKRLLKRLKDVKSLDLAPDLAEFMSCLVKEFGGAEAFAKEVKKEYDVAAKNMRPTILRTMLKFIEVNTAMGGADSDLSEASDEDIELEVKHIMRAGGKYGIE
jgi:hypothetical protein